MTANLPHSTRGGMAQMYDGPAHACIAAEGQSSIRAGVRGAPPNGALRMPPVATTVTTAHFRTAMNEYDGIRHSLLKSAQFAGLVSDA